MHENHNDGEPPLSEFLEKLMPVDLVLIEGYKRDRHPKVEAHRAETKQGLISANDDTITAVASNYEVKELPIPQFDLDDVSGIADFILKEVGLE